MTGLPYDVQAGDAFMDNDDPLRRLGFKGGGIVSDPLKRMGFGVGGKVAKEAVNYLEDSLTNIISKYSKKEIDPLQAEKAADEILGPFRGSGDMPGELDDPEFQDFIKATVKAQLEEKHGMSQEEMKVNYPEFYNEKGVLQGGDAFSKARGYTDDEIDTFAYSSELGDIFDPNQDVTAHINDTLRSISALNIEATKKKLLKEDTKQKVSVLNNTPKRKKTYTGGYIDKDMKRIDGTIKSERGFLGPIVSKVTGKTMTEVSVGGGKDEPLIPTLVPTLTKDEIEIMRNIEFEGNPKAIPKSIINKALKHAAERRAQGLDPFYQDGE